MIDLIKSSRWNVLKRKAKSKDQKEQWEYNTSMLAAIENVHDIAIETSDRLGKINNDLYGGALLILKGLIKDDRIMDILKDNLSEEEYTHLFGRKGETKGEDK